MINHKDTYLNEQILDFLWFSYFGITYTDAPQQKDKALMCCIDRAYIDLCRTIEFYKSSSKMNAKEVIEKKQHIAMIKIQIKDKIKTEILSSDLSKDLFDKKHDEICQYITEQNPKVSDKQNLFENNLTFGQAQKWLNMTLKYMWLMGLWCNNLKTEYLHIPIDSYIIKAAKKNKIKLSENDTQPWSKWDKDTYKTSQDNLRRFCKSVRKSPIEWESETWPNIAKEMNKKE